MPDKKQMKFKLSENRGLIMMAAGLLFFVLFGCILMHLAGSAATLEGVPVTVITVLTALSLILMILGDGQRKIDRHKTDRRNCLTALSIPQLLLVAVALLSAARVVAGNFSVDSLQIVLSFVLFAAVLAFLAALVKSVLLPADPAPAPAAPKKAPESPAEPDAAAPGKSKLPDLLQPEKPAPEKNPLTLRCDRCGEVVNMRTLRLVNDAVYCGYCYRELFPEKKEKKENNT